MSEIKFGWDYWDYSRQPDIRKIIKKDFNGFSPDGVYPNDSDTLPLFDSNYQPTNAWHNIYNILQHHYDGYTELENKDTIEYIKNNESFIYVIATNGGPVTWCGGDTERNTLFHNIKEHTKEHIRKGKVLITIDLSFEGFPIDGTDKLSILDMGKQPHLAETVHKRAEEEKFPLENIVFLSGNYKDVEYYKNWCKRNKIKTPMNWILLDWCERAISSDYKHLTDRFEDHFNYKKDNINNLKHYLCLCRRLKTSRLFHHLGLNYFNLLDKGSVSCILPRREVSHLFPELNIDKSKMEMNNAGVMTFSDCANLEDYEFNKTLKDGEMLYGVVDEFYTRFKHFGVLGRTRDLIKVRGRDNIRDFVKKLPLIVDRKTHDTLDSFHHWDSKLYKDTMFSYIYETWSMSTNMVFFSEKIYKAILNFHPFLGMINSETLKFMRRNGYKSFSPFIEESYDEEGDPDIRSELLLKEMVRLCEMPINKMLDWYGDQSDILVHNYDIFMTNTRLEESAEQFLNVWERVDE